MTYSRPLSSRDRSRSTPSSCGAQSSVEIFRLALGQTRQTVMMCVSTRSNLSARHRVYYVRASRPPARFRHSPPGTSSTLRRTYYYVFFSVKFQYFFFFYFVIWKHFVFTSNNVFFFRLFVRNRTIVKKHLTITYVL